MIKKGWKDMELDRELIQLRIDVIERNLLEISDIVAEGYSSFQNNYRNELAAKQALLESIGACIDIGNHIIAVKGFRRPVDYKDVFMIMEGERIVDKPLSSKLQEMAKFRNLLVNRYMEIQNKRLFNIMKSEVVDL